MALFQINRAPTDRTLRQFAAIAAVAFPTLAWVATRNTTAAVFAATIGGAALLTWSRPQLLKRPFVWVSLATAPIGMVLGEVLLLTMYFGVFAPIGLLFKLIGRDPLSRKFDRSAKSYWVERTASRAPATYLRQF